MGSWPLLATDPRNSRCCWPASSLVISEAVTLLAGLSRSRIISLPWCHCLLLGAAGASTHLKVMVFLACLCFKCKLCLAKKKKSHYGDKRSEQCRSISQTPSAESKGRQKSMGSSLARAAAWLEAIPVTSSSACP